MHIAVALLAGFVLGVALTLIYRLRVEDKLSAEKAALIERLNKK
jgi:hypothetical protein